MKIATFNINNINKRLANLIGWLRRQSLTSCAFRSSNRRTKLPERSDRKSRLQRGFPRAEIVERSCHTARGREPVPRDARYPAIQPTSRAAISRRR